MTSSDAAAVETAELIAALERSMTELHGPMMSDEALRIALGYRTGDAFRQAVWRKKIPVPVFNLPNRRGKFALTRDVAIWLAEQRTAAMIARTEALSNVPRPSHKRSSQ